MHRRDRPLDLSAARGHVRRYVRFGPGRARPLSHPLRRVGLLPPPRPHPHRRRHPCPPSTAPARGDQPHHPRRRAQPRRRAPHAPVGRPPRRPRAHRPPRGRAGRVRARRLARRRPPSAASWAAGEELLVTGRVRRRFFRAGGEHPEPHRGRRRPGSCPPAGRRPPARRWHAALAEPARAVVTARRGSAMMGARRGSPKGWSERNHAPGAAGEGPGGQGLHRRPRPERRQHAEGPQALRGRARTPTTARPRCSTASTRCARRIVTSPSFSGDRVLGAILFEQTMDRQIEGRDTPEYLWEVKGVVPFLKIDKGLEDEADGVQLMKPMPGLDALLERAVAKGVFGTKDALGRQAGRPQGRPGHRRPAVRGRAAGPRPRAGADPRARGRHQEPAEGRGRGAPQGGAPRRARLHPRRAAGDVQAHPPRGGRLLRRARRPPEGRQGRGAVGRLHPRRGQRPPRPQQGRDRQLLPGAHRGPHAPSRPTRSSTPRSTPASSPSTRRRIT